MSLSIRPVLILAVCAAGCGASSNGGGGGDLAGCCPDLGAGADLAGGACNIATSPSGYACDPWSTHLYVAETIKRNGSKLRLLVVHNPDNEGHVDDQAVPPEHDYSQLLTVDVDLTDAVRHFLCVVFTPSATPASFDAASPTFLTDVNHSGHTLLSDDSNGTAHVANLTDICGGSTVPGLPWPSIAASGQPALADIALAIPLQPRPRDFTVGTTFSAWLARGILYVDEQSELAPALSGTVVAVQ